ncbi:ABC transporter substrate-binding protein [Microbacterium sp. NPDC087592]|uniref:ABC transporter substrate-binding protein n=1 Tax=Microbacterium sp. NPDC087592 TaxID=3364193 RepID=UPI0038001466
MTAPRNRLLGAIAATVLTITLAACSTSTGGSPGPTNSDEPEAGGTLKVALNAWAPTNLDPHQQGNSNDPLIFRAIFDTLFWQKEDGTFEGLLAESYDLSDDGRVYTIHLRPDITFQDDSPLTAEVVRQNIEHIFDPATAAPLQASYLGPYESSKAIDDLTLEITLSEPYSALINVLSQAYLSIISGKQLTEAPETIVDHPIGTGPFEVVDWRADESLTLERNDDYAWAPESDAGRTGAAYLDGIEISFVAEDSVRYNGLVAGDFDVIDWTPPQSVESVLSNDSLEFTKFDRPGHPYSLWLNENNAPLDDQAVRQAIFAGLDRKAIIDAVSFGQWTVADGFLVPSTPNYAENSTATFTYDVDQANEILDDAGWSEVDSDGFRTKDGERLSLYFPTTGDVTQANQILEIVQDQLKDIGVEVQIDLLSSEDQQARVAAGEQDISAGIWTTNTADVLFIKYSSTEVTTPERRGTNQTNTADAELDELVAAARASTDADEIADLYARAQERLTEIVPSIPLHYRPSLVSSQDGVHGLAFDRAYGNLWFYNTWKEGAGS